LFVFNVLYCWITVDKSVNQLGEGRAEPVMFHVEHPTGLARPSAAFGQRPVAGEEMT
jgi:hypothetical protein